MDYQNSREYALAQDAQDELRSFREQFYIPKVKGETAIYFTGNSLGLQPKGAQKALEVELKDWAKLGVEGHFHARHPWYSYHERFTPQVAQLFGAKETEVVLMNTLTANLHFLLVSFFQPEGKRNKILCEAKAFPSDQYALESQLKFHRLDPKEHLIEIAPKEGQHIIEEEDIVETINKHGDEIALIMIGGVNYYSGQVFDMKKITDAGHAVGAKVGFDLAHGAGNIALSLHDWGPDFACWCTYKYLNSGPGSVSGIFVHERHARNSELPRFAGWWGYDKDARFAMESGFKPIPGAEGWQLSNAPVFNMAIHKVSLDLFEKAGMERLCHKSKKLTGYLEFIVKDIAQKNDHADFEIITPEDESRRGCQLSILAHGYGRPLFDALTEKGVIADWREPNVIRCAPVPMYNNFEDIYRFGQALQHALKTVTNA